jgi:DNA adenine methylase
MAETVPRPVLRYFGGKWRIAPWIIEHFPQHKIYTEPFGGAASVLLRKPRASIEVYNDLNSRVVNLFKVLRDPEKAEELKRRLDLTPFSHTEFYDALESLESKEDDLIESARKLIVVSFMGFGSDAISGKRKTGFRFMPNCKFEGRHPVAQAWSTYPDIIPAVVKRLKGVIISNLDALEVIKAYDHPEALHYLDPPYPFKTRKDISNGRSKANYVFEMDDSKHEEMIQFLKSGKIEGMVVLSSYKNTIYDSLGWEIRKKKTTDMMNNNREEVLYLCPRTCLALKRRDGFSLDLTV